MKRVFLLGFVTMLFLKMVSGQSVNNRGLLPEKKGASTPETGRLFGVVIGISDYKNLPALKYADRDAQYFYEFLQASARSTAEKKNIHSFLNEQADRDRITESLYEINDSVKSGDRVYIYFGGHGDLEQLTQIDNCLLLLQNAPEKNYLRRSNSYLDINLFRDFFNAWSEKNVRTIFVCDACHSGKLMGGETGRKNTLLGLQQSWKNEIRMLSCQPDELSLEGPQWGGGRGLFSYFLIAGLQGMADKNKDSLISLFEIQGYVRDSVSEHSEQAQIPSVTGDVKVMLNAYDKQMLSDAKSTLKQRKTGTETNTGIALKGNEERDILASLKDSVLKIKYRQFIQAIDADRLISSQPMGAVSIYKSFPESDETRIARGYMKLLLLQHLQADFNSLTEYLYNDRYDQYDFTKRYAAEIKIKAALEITGRNHLLYNKLRAAELFLYTCNAFPEIQKGVSLSSRIQEQLQTGIDSLKNAVKLDPLAPFLHLQLGNFYLYTGQFEASIESYLTYTRLLPNDEYTYNRLGMAYYLSGNFTRASEMFKKSLRINPNFSDAAENLRISQKKAG